MAKALKSFCGLPSEHSTTPASSSLRCAASIASLAGPVTPASSASASFLAS